MIITAHNKIQKYPSPQDLTATKEIFLPNNLSGQPSFLTQYKISTYILFPTRTVNMSFNEVATQ